MLVGLVGVLQQNHYRSVEKQRGEWPFDTIHSQDLYMTCSVLPIVYGKPHQDRSSFEIRLYSLEVEVKMGKAEQVMSDQELRVVEWNYLVGFAGWQIYWWAV